MEQIRFVAQGFTVLTFFSPSKQEMCAATNKSHQTKPDQTKPNQTKLTDVIEEDGAADVRW
jgi:hypothetical protein